jgi:cell division protein FtsW (lipid II flippase)
MSDAALYLDRRRRRRELILLIFAVLISVAAYVLVELGRKGRVPVDILGYGMVLLGSYLFAHLVMRRFARSADPVLLPTAGLLAGLSLAMIFRLKPALVGEQTLWLLLGLGLFSLTLAVVRDHKQLDQYTYTIGLLGIALMLLPLVPGIGRTVRGAQLWVQIGPMQFQPSEIAKVLLVVFLASYLGARRELLSVGTRRLGPVSLPEPRHLAPLLIAWGLSLAILFLEQDLGSNLLFFGMFVVMLWLATARSAYLVLGGVLFAAGAAFAYATLSHVQDRVTVWLDPLNPETVTDTSFQLAQSLFALATGGIAGTGLGQGLPTAIPDVHTDVVFSAFGEELGLIGTMALLVLFMIIVFRGFRAAVRCRDGFGQLLAAGLATVFGLQTFVIIGGVTRLIPLTGVTLPFVSYGGSSLVANFVLLALLVRVSSDANRAPAIERSGEATEVVRESG